MSTVKQVKTLEKEELNIFNLVQDWCRDRALVYRALSEVFSVSVSSECLMWLASPAFSAILESLNISPEYRSVKLHEGIQALKAALQEIEYEPFSKELSQEYSFLFILGAREKVHPYASVYLSGWRRVMGDAWVKAKEFYEQNNLVLEEHCDEMEDHISVQCDFINHLCTLTLKAARRRDHQKMMGLLEKQETFIREHMLVWIPQYCNDLLRVSNHPFYTSMAKIMEGFLEMERQTLAGTCGG